jgi:hypothetical protein
MNGDEMISVGPRLAPGRHLLTCVRLQSRLVVSWQVGQTCLIRGHIDVLGGELVVDLVGDVDVGPQQKSPSHEEHDGEDESSDRDEPVEC